MELDAGQYVARLSGLLAAQGQPLDVMSRASAHAQSHRLGLGAALVAMGVDEGLLLQASSEASGLPVLRALPVQQPGLANGFDLSRCQAMPMAPVDREGPVVVVACTDPLVALTGDAQAMPPHRLVLAPLALVQQALARLFGDGKDGAERAAPSGRSKAFAPSSRAEVATRPAAPAGDGLPRVMGGFERLDLVGQGGMASVFRGREQGSGRLVALKVMHPHLAQDKDFVARFLQEARATRHLAHPNIVQVLGYGREGEKPWMASEFMDHGTLEELLGSMGRMPTPLALEIFAQALQGVAAAHAQGIIHRDLKPANLLLSQAGVVKIGDFGIAKVEGAAKLPQTGAVLGTPAYMSPEQANAVALTPATDVFSMGIILYELLSGQNPHNAESAAAAMVKVLAATVAPLAQVVPGLDPAAEALVERLLVKEPPRRPAVGELVAELEAWLSPWRAKGRNLVAEALADPHGAKERLWAEEARALFFEAKALLARGPGERRPAALVLYRASLLAPSDAELSRTFGALCAEEKLSSGAAKNPKIVELEEALDANRDAPGVLQQLANLHKLEGNVFQAAFYLKQYVRLKPNDGYAIGQLQQLDRSAQPRKPGPEEDTFRELAPGAGASNVLVELWRAHGRLLGLAAGLALVVALAVRWTSSFIERSSGEQDRAQRAQLATTASAPGGPADPLSLRFAAARAALAQGRPSEAVAAMDELIVSQPESPRRGEAYLVRGEAHLRLGRLPNAQSDLGEALSLLPPTADALRQRAQSLVQQAQGSRQAPAPIAEPPSDAVPLE